MHPSFCDKNLCKKVTLCAIDCTLILKLGNFASFDTLKGTIMHKMTQFVPYKVH